jgi:hypothetical protein
MLGGIVGIVVFLLLFFYATFYNKGCSRREEYCSAFGNIA